MGEALIAFGSALVGALVGGAATFAAARHQRVLEARRRMRREILPALIQSWSGHMWLFDSKSWTEAYEELLFEAEMATWRDRWAMRPLRRLVEERERLVPTNQHGTDDEGNPMPNRRMAAHMLLMRDAAERLSNRTRRRLR